MNKTRGELAESYFKQGYNCAQAVLLAFGEETGLAAETAALISSSFGGGIGRLREVCGAFSGACMASGLLQGYCAPGATGEKQAHYKRIQELAGAFREENGAILCRELLELPTGPSDPAPEARTAGYYLRRPCGELVRSAADLLDERFCAGEKS